MSRRATRVTFIRQLREQHGLPVWAMARALRLPRSTGGAWLRLNRLPGLPPVPIQRYEWPHPGDLLHMDIKPLGRFRRVGHRIHGNPRQTSPGAGWEYVHVAVDDHTRLAYVELLGDQTGTTCAAFWDRAVAWYAARQITVHRVMSDNGNGDVCRRFQAACHGHALRHLRTRPYTPRTNDKADASFRRCCVSGPMSSRIRRLATGGERCAPGCGTTITTGRTAACTMNRPCHDSRVLRDERRV